MQFPRAILHVDGDYFFVSCELASKPWLVGRPVVTGQERGIASAMSPEAKALGVHRGMPVYRIRREFPQVVILPGDYRSYELYSHRMYDIVRRYTPQVEEYSIDECFADLSGASLPYAEIVARIRDDLWRELGVSFSVGLSVNKVLAKAASKYNKPRGFTVIAADHIREYISSIPIEKLWGIGPSTAVFLKKRGVLTALDLSLQTRDWAVRELSAPIMAIYEELRGNFVMPVAAGSDRLQLSVMKTATFKPPSSDKTYVFAELSTNIEEACLRLRQKGLMALRAGFFLKTQSFEYSGGSVELAHHAAVPEPIIQAVKPAFEKAWRAHTLYRATGVTLSSLIPVELRTQELFDDLAEARKPLGSTYLSKLGRIHARPYRLGKKYGRDSLFIGASALIKQTARRIHARPGKISHSHRAARIGMPILGTVD